MVSPLPPTGITLVGFGEAMVLLTAPAGGDLATTPVFEGSVAGAEFNVCVAAARLGVTARFCSAVGRDPLGERIIRQLRQEDVDASLVIQNSLPTGVFFKDVRPDGSRRVHYYRRNSAASRLAPADTERALAIRPDVVVVSGLTAVLGDDTRAAVRVLCSGAAALGATVVVDPNLRPSYVSNALVCEAVRELLPHTTMLLLGTDEAPELFGTDEPVAVLRAARDCGIDDVVLKAGAGGVWHVDGDRMRHLPAPDVAVVDPVGAGDAFCAGYVVARAAGANPAAAARLGTRLAGAVLTTAGDTSGLPPREHAEEWLREALGDNRQS